MGGCWWYEAESLVFGWSESASSVYIALFKDEERRVTSRFNLFVSDYNQGNEEVS